MAVYMLKFSKQLGNLENPHGKAGFYLGFCEEGNMPKRLKQHRAGQGASITRAAIENGIEF